MDTKKYKEVKRKYQEVVRELRERKLAKLIEEQAKEESALLGLLMLTGTNLGRHPYFWAPFVLIGDYK